MAGKTYQDPWVKKARWLTQVLIISATLNVGLLSTLIYFAMRDNSPSLALKSGAKQSKSSKNLALQDLLASYKALSFDELLAQMGNCDHVESGFTKRDLALACLVAFRHFNLEKALGGAFPQKREITITQDEKEIPL